MTRFPDWPERLAAFIEARRRMPFAWGGHDCAMFAADAVVAITGTDPLALWRGSYADEAGAEAALGGLPLAMFMDAALLAAGATRVETSMAQRGDFVILDVGNMPTCGVCLGGSVAAPGVDRLHFLPMRLIRQAWAI